MNESYLVDDVLHYCNIETKGCSKIYEHVIDYYDFTFVLEGKMVYWANGSRYELCSNDAIFLPPQTRRARDKGNTTAKYVSFNLQLYPHAALPFPEFMPACITPNIRRLVSVYPDRHLSDQHHSKAKCTSMLNYILLELMDNISPVSNNPHVVKMLEYINTHETHRLTLTDISRHTNLSREYCSYIFKKETGKTLIHYINEKKMLIARDLIINHEMALTDISTYLGYDNYNYFSRLFKRYYDTPPVRLKNEQKKN